MMMGDGYRGAWRWRYFRASPEGTGVSVLVAIQGKGAI
jgi:hypothetical protein